MFTVSATATAVDRQDRIARVKHGYLFPKAHTQLPKDVCSGRERIPQRACGTMIGKAGERRPGGWGDAFRRLRKADSMNE